MHKYIFSHDVACFLPLSFFSAPKRLACVRPGRKKKSLYKISFLTHAFETHSAHYWRPIVFRAHFFLHSIYFRSMNFSSSHLIIYIFTRFKEAFHTCIEEKQGGKIIRSFYNAVRICFGENANR